MTLLIVCSSYGIIFGTLEKTLENTNSTLKFINFMENLESKSSNTLNIIHNKLNKK